MVVINKIITEVIIDIGGTRSLFDLRATHKFGLPVQLATKILKF